MHIPSWITLLLLSAMLVGCTTPSDKASCGQRDWYELGRHDGAQGATLGRQEQYRAECSSEFGAHAETIYANGRNAGLVEFCQVDNAFQLGRMGINYLYVCPTTMESTFLISYRRGQQARLLELKKKDLEAKIETLSQRLQTMVDSTLASRAINTELSELKKLRAANDVELTKISK